MEQHIIVVSHRRSGTHLTIDTIRNNFEMYKAPYISLKQLYLRKEDNTYIKSFIKKMKKSPRVFKSHSILGIQDFYQNSIPIIDFTKDLLQNHKIIYVHRDGRDVLTSLYYHENQQDTMSFSEFLRSKNSYYEYAYKGEKNKIEYWKFHIEGWFEYAKEKNNILLVRFEDLIQDYDNSLNRIASFIGNPIKSSKKDVRLNNEDFVPKWKNIEVTSKEIIYTHVNFRKGTIGDYKNIFSNSDLDYYFNILNSNENN